MNVFLGKLFVEVGAKSFAGQIFGEGLEFSGQSKNLWEQHSFGWDVAKFLGAYILDQQAL